MSGLILAPAAIIAPIQAELPPAPLDAAMHAHAQCIAHGFDERIAFARAFEAAAFADLDVLVFRGPAKQEKRINQKHERAGRRLMLAIAETEERARWSRF